MKTKALSIFLLGSAFAFAQSGARTPPTPEQLVERRVAALTRLLTLTETQQSQAKTIFATPVNLEVNNREALRTAHTSLGEAVKSNNIAGIDQAVATISNLTAQHMAANSKAEAAFYQILTADQKTAYDEARPGRGMMGPGMGGPGMGGPGPGRMGPRGAGRGR
jgi:Spy/CpxP family protein refolding chaperone